MVVTACAYGQGCRRQGTRFLFLSSSLAMTLKKKIMSSEPLLRRRPRDISSWGSYK